MILTGFIGDDIHGFLRTRVSFNKDLSLLTGINGSGKTTILNLMVALLTPSISTLANIEYKKIRISFDHENKSHFIESRHEDSRILLNVKGIKDILSIPKFILEEEIPSYKELDHEQQYYREVITSLSQHPVLSFITNLPTPMFLGLDRRSRFDDEDRGRLIGRRLTRPKRSGHPVFGSSLAGSLMAAAGLAETAYRDTFIAVGRVGNDLRRDMLLTLLTVQPAEGFGPLSIPSKTDAQEIVAMRRDVTALPLLLGLPENEVTKRILPFLDLLEGHVKKIPPNTKAKDIFKIKDQDLVKSIISWSVNKSQLEKIQSMSKLVSSYNERVEKLTEKTNSYLNIINKFLYYSKKGIHFDERGDIYFSIDKIKEKIEVTALSSGEAQIFVILTHLFFNSMDLSGNVFIVDEPELSLHVHWQELFVDSIMLANNNVQYVLATHSPSIILDRTDKCVNLNNN